MENEKVQYWWNNLPIRHKMEFVYNAFNRSFDYKIISHDEITMLHALHAPKEGLRLFLDDVRPTPKGWLRFRTAEAMIEFLTWNHDKIEAVSLDNDLGKGYTEGRMVARWLEEQAFNGTLKTIPHLAVHSDNNVAIADMNAAFKNIKKYWKQNGNS